MWGFLSASNSVKKKLHPYPMSNAEIKHPYFLVACVTSEKERADETEDTACPYPNYEGHLPHYALKTTQSWKTLLVAGRFHIEEPGLLDYCAVWLSNCSPTFRRNVLPSSSESVVCELNHNTEEGGRFPRNIIKKSHGYRKQISEDQVSQQLHGGSLKLLFSYC